MNTNDVKDWSNLCAQTMIKREPNLDTGKWRYEDGLMLDGMYDVFRRTGNTKYFLNCQIKCNTKNLFLEVV